MKTVTYKSGLRFFLLLLVIVSCVACGHNRHRRPKGHSSTKNHVVNNITIIEKHDNNNTYNQQQYQNIIIQNIDNSSKSNITRTIYNIQNNYELITINNTDIKVSVDNSSHNNYISQTAVQQIQQTSSKAPPTRKRGRKREPVHRKVASHGDLVRIDEVVFNGATVNGVVAEVNDEDDSPCLTLCPETYEDLKKALCDSDPYFNSKFDLEEENPEEDENYDGSAPAAPAVSDDGSGHGEVAVSPERESESSGNIRNDRTRSHEVASNKEMREEPPYRNTSNDAGGMNVFTIIGIIVVLLFAFWVASWFVNF